MDSTTTSSLLLGHIADIAKAVPCLGINHVKVAGGRLTASNFHNNIYVNVNVSSLDHEEEAKWLELSIEASLQNIALIRSLGKTSNPGKAEISVKMSGNNYLFVDDHKTLEIPKIAIRQTSTTITEFLMTGQIQGTVITLSGINELSLKGNETSVLLGVYGEQLASVIAPGQPEHFFAADTSRQMKRKERTLYRSNGFLKFGEPDFDLALYSINRGIWLFTTGIISDGVPFQVVEKIETII